MERTCANATANTKTIQMKTSQDSLGTIREALFGLVAGGNHSVDAATHIKIPHHRH